MADFALRLIHVPAPVVGSIQTAPLPYVRKHVAMEEAVRAQTIAIVPDCGLEKTVVLHSVSLLVRMEDYALLLIRALVLHNTAISTAPLQYAIKASLSIQ